MTYLGLDATNEGAYGFIGPKRGVRVAFRGEEYAIDPDRVPGVRESSDLIDEWMHTFVSKFFLPKKLRAATKRGAVKMPVPIETLEALITRVQTARLKGQKSVSVGLGTVTELLDEVGIAA